MEFLSSSHRLVVARCPLHVVNLKARVEAVVAHPAVLAAVRHEADDERVDAGWKMCEEIRFKLCKEL